MVNPATRHQQLLARGGGQCLQPWAAGPELGCRARSPSGSGDDKQPGSDWKKTVCGATVWMREGPRWSQVGSLTSSLWLLTEHKTRGSCGDREGFRKALPVRHEWPTLNQFLKIRNIELLLNNFILRWDVLVLSFYIHHQVSNPARGDSQVTAPALGIGGANAGSRGGWGEDLPGWVTAPGTGHLGVSEPDCAGQERWV